MSSIIPLNATTPDDLLVVDALFDSLTQWDEDLTVQPAAAVRWEQRGLRTWRFHLRRGATFSDGAPVTAGHFVRTWNQLALRGEAHHHLRDVAGYERVLSGAARTLAGVRGVDERTLDVRLSRPNADFPAVAGHPALAPMRSAAARSSAALNEPVGNGPFRMAEPWAHGRFVRLRRVAPAETAAVRSGAPVEELVFQIHDPASAFIAYEQGGLDVATVPGGGLQGAQPDGQPARQYLGPGLLTGELASTYFLVANTAHPPLHTAVARRGISLALDRRAIIDHAFEGNGTPAAGIVPPAIPAGRRRACLDCTHNPARARRLLARAGVRGTTVWVSKDGDHEKVAAQVRADLSAVGVQARIRAVKFERFLSALRRGRPGLFRFGWTLDYPTADNALRPLSHSSMSAGAGGANFARLVRPDVDALLDRAGRTRDEQRRTALYRRAEDRLLGRHHALIPVAVLRRRTVVADRVRGLRYGPLGNVDFAAVRLFERDGEAD